MSEVLARLIEKPVGPSFEFGNFRVERAITHLENLEIFRFRYRVYLESGFISQDDFPEPVFRDEFDAVSSQIAVRDASGTLVGSTRFLGPSPLGFHTQKVFDIDLPAIDVARIGEFGRLAVRVDHRGGDRLVMLALLKAVFECMIDRGSTHILAFLPPPLAESFSRIGCKPLEMVAREPTNFVLQNRRLMRGYFELQNPIPVLYDLEKMLDDVGVRRVVVAKRLSHGSLVPSPAFADSRLRGGGVEPSLRTPRSDESNRLRRV